MGIILVFSDETDRVAMRITFLIWLLALSGATSVLMDYSNRPGEHGETPKIWPEIEGFKYQSDKPTLVMLVHPKCSCSSASLRELERVLARFPDKMHTYLFFYAPSNTESWLDSKLWKQAQAISGVRLIEDGDGARAELFDSFTSGHVVLYNQKGQLAFSGGITSGRGHEGESLGRESLENYLHHGFTLGEASPIFGCALREQSRI